MGIYIQAPSQFNKSALVVEKIGGRLLYGGPEPLAEGEVLLCEVMNGQFSALAIIFDADELRDFTAPDPRAKTWAIVNRVAAFELAGQPDPVGPDGVTGLEQGTMTEEVALLSEIVSSLQIIKCLLLPIAVAAVFFVVKAIAGRDDAPVDQS